MRPGLTVAQGARRRGARIACCAALLVVALPLAAWAFVLLRPGPLPHTHVRLSDAPADTFELPAQGGRARFLEERAGVLAQRTVRVETGFHAFRPTYAELGVAFVPSDVRRDAAALGRSANPVRALRGLARSVRGAGNEVRWRPRIVRPALLEAYVRKMGRLVYRPSIPGTWDGEGNPIEGIPSEELNCDLTISAIEQALPRGETVARVATQVLKPPEARVPYERFRRTDAESAATELLTVQQTRYVPGTDRAVNVELATQKLDRQVMLPGARLSFNAVVGKRTLARGFRPAPEVRGGRLVDPDKEPCPACVGGGVCQVAGTLHAAAFFAGLDILEQEPHSRLPAVCYLPPGLDTRVVWDPNQEDLARTKDFVIRNPYPFPVVLRASAIVGRLQIALYGAMRPYRVDCCYSVERERSGREGEAGVTITRMRTVYKPDGRPVERKQIAYSDPDTCMHDRGWTTRCEVCGSHEAVQTL